MAKQSKFIRIFKRRDDGLPGQALRYAVVAFSGFLADYLVLLLLSVVFDIHYLISAAIAFVAGLAINYVLGLILVFKRGQMRRALEIFLFLLISLVALGITELMMWLLTDVVAGLHHMFSKIIAALVAYVWNFLTRRYILYRPSA